MFQPRSTIFTAGKISFFLLLALILASNFSTSVIGSNGIEVSNTQSSIIEFRMTVHVYDIFQNSRTASVKIFLWFDDFPYEVSEVVATIRGIGDDEVTLQCEAQNDSMYFANSEMTTWSLIGYGEIFPFDSYEMRFQLVTERVYVLIDNSSNSLGQNVQYSLKDKSALFSGSKSKIMRDTWRTSDFVLPIKSHSSTGFSANIERNWILPTLQLIFPIILCFYVLGGTVLIRRDDLQARLTIYLSLFIFAPTFLIAVQNFLPYRSSLSLPEFLLLSLLTGNAILAFFAMWPEEKILLSNRRIETDDFAVGAVLTSLLGILSYAFLISVSLWGSYSVAILVLLVAFGYFIGLLKKTWRDFGLLMILDSLGFGLLIGGYLSMILAFLRDDPATFLGALVFAVIGLFVIIGTRLINRRRGKPSPFPSDETIGADYPCYLLRAKH